MFTDRTWPSLSIEVEPPQIHSRKLEQNEIYKFTNIIKKTAPLVDLISVTNRPTFRMSSISTMKLILSILRDTKQANTTFPILHLTTRLSIVDTFNELLDARRLGIEYLLPVLGEPRGPKNKGFFENSLDLLAFIKTGTDSEDNISNGEKFQSISELNNSFIEDGNFNIGTVIDPNKTRRSRNGKLYRIREKQIELFGERKEVGARFFITQGIFDPSEIFEFLDEVECKNTPVGVGLIPPTFTIENVIGAQIPHEIKLKLKKKSTKKEQFKIAIDITRDNYRTLRDNGIDWIHLYCLNRPNIVFSIIQDEPFEIN
ncbi:MAG: methylenetetrahydrofolate reductase [Candidatus Hodarchaeales archaeon]|jgi:5,10-methylenetetrahydrofolate reductase